MTTLTPMLQPMAMATCSEGKAGPPSWSSTECNVIIPGTQKTALLSKREAKTIYGAAGAES